jgi:hypothetical protein
MNIFLIPSLPIEISLHIHNIRQKYFENRITEFQKIFKPKRLVFGGYTTFYEYIQHNSVIVTCTKIFRT